MEEIWRKASGYESYEISNLGGLRNLKGKILKLKTDDWGYKYFESTYKTKRISISIHRTVLKTFVGECPNGFECSHLDGNPANNIVTNLRWTSHRDNISLKKSHNTQTRGEMVHRSRFTEQDIMDMRNSYKNGIDASLIAEKYGLNVGNLKAIITGLTWKHLGGSSEWRYKTNNIIKTRRKLTYEQANQIREEYKNNTSLYKLAEKYKVSVSSIYSIVQNITYTR